MSRAAFTLIELLVVIGFAAPPALARPLGAELDGTELLCELEAFGPTSVMPGIYKLDMDGTATRIVSYGRAPRWLPDRRRFWFIRPEGAQPAAQVALLDEHVTRPLSWAATCGMVWRPGKEGWACVQSAGAGFPFCGAGPVVWFSPMGEEPGEVLYEDRKAFVRNVAFSSDGERMAFETLRYHTGAPISEAHSLVAMDLRDGSRGSPDLSALGPGYPLRPQWQPGGELVAFEFHHASPQSRSVAVWDLADDSIRSLVLRKAGLPFGVDGWSSDGSKLLVHQLYPETDSAWVLDYFDVDEWAFVDGPSSFEKRLWSPCWNHDGTKIAYCVGQGDCLQCEPFGQVYVFDLATEETTKIELPANCRPVCLTW